MPVKICNFKSLFRHALYIFAISFFLSSCRDPAPANETATPAPAAPTPSAAAKSDLPAIVAFGDSLTAGYGLSERDSYTTLLQRKVEESGYRYRVINAGISGDTTAGGVARIDWALEGNVKYLILELGGNDGLRGLPISEMKKNLSTIIERAQARGVTVLLAAMESPPNMGEEYTRQYRQVFPELAKKYKIALAPFILNGVGGRPEMNQPDGIHPNAEGEKIMTENVWKVLKPLLK